VLLLTIYGEKNPLAEIAIGGVVAMREPGALQHARDLRRPRGRLVQYWRRLRQ
jgi:hypothetical protein